MTWQINLYAIPFLLTTLPLGYCAQLAWKRRARLPERLFLALTAALLWLVVVYAIRLLSSDPEVILWLAKLEYPVNQLSAALWLLFILAYVGYEEWITRRMVGVLFMFPAIYMGVVWSNEYHHLHWSQVGVAHINSKVFFSYSYSYSLTFWLSVFYIYLLLLAATVVIVRRLTRAPLLFRWQSRTLLLASLLPWAATVVDLARANPLPAVDATLCALLLSVGLLAWSLFRFRLLELAPAAHDMVVRSMSDPVMLLDLEHRIVDANPAAARFFGTPVHEMIGCPVMKFFPNNAEQFASLLHADEIRDEITYTANGQLCYFDIRINVLRNRWDVPHGRVIIVRDISEQKRAEQQAVQLALEQQKVSLLREFIDTTSHDLNTPLTTLRISTDLLRAYANRMPAQMDRLRTLNGSGAYNFVLTDMENLVKSIVTNGARINESTIRLQRMVSEMLEMVRLDKEQPLQKRPASLNEIGQQAVAELGAIETEKNITLRVETDGALPTILVDAKQIEIALKHLLRNAITHTGSGGAVTLRMRLMGEWAVAEIIDTGIGIPTDDLPHVFERFYRGDKTRGAQSGGMGLGLAIVKKIVAAHQGYVEVESTLGHGSTFRLRLPAPQRDPALPPTSAPVRMPA